ncbi:hypothetical protein [Geodermatophilus sp. SYSU D00815]
METTGSAVRERALRWAAPALIVALQLVVTVLRVVQVRGGYGARNLEASYHALLTAESLLRTPLSRTWGLPIVTLGEDNDKWISWGATVATSHGDYVYTSFPPAGFWLPTLAAAVRGGELGMAGLVLLNGVLAAVTGVLLYVLVQRAVVRMDRSVWLARGAGVAAAVVYLFSAEALQSHGTVYWPHSMLQPLLVGQLVLLERLLLPSASTAARRRLLWGLGLLTLVACYTEWTAYVFAFLTGALLLAVPALRRRAAAAGVVLVAVAAATAVLLSLHFVLAIGFDGAVEAWRMRFVARSGSGATYLGLFYGYALSFGAALLAALAVTGLAMLRPSPRARRDAVSLAIVAFSLTAVVENVVLLQHASQFTFDRLKLGVPLALLTGLAIGRLTRRGVAAAAVAVCAAALLGVAADRADSAGYQVWTEADRHNRTVVDQAREEIDLSCATLATNTSVRGYLNLLFDRGIHEMTGPEELAELARDEDSCGTVYIEAQLILADLPQISSITVVHAGGDEVTLPRSRP